jgi:hypothetical protein
MTENGERLPAVADPVHGVFAQVFIEQDGPKERADAGNA